ncbi:MAG: histidinol dehydrogenase [Actinobacteria bacterium]|nr:histidinol dehydrogenase [Actinomycetota bacterium]
MHAVFLSQLNQGRIDAIKNRSADAFITVMPQAKAIMEDIRQNGDAALRRYTKQFDGVDLAEIQVHEADLRAAVDQVSPGVLDALKCAAANLSTFHASHLASRREVSPIDGIKLWREWRPIETVGIYVPGGKARYPSSVLMNAIPAKTAGCDEIILCSPPAKDGQVPAATLAAAAVSGVTRVFRIGGAQAIAAMAYGTESVPQVLKIFGAGNNWVTAAKMLAFGQVNIDMPAGPSEVLIIAGREADPRFVAADMVSQAEHGEDSASLLLTDSPELARSVCQEMDRQLEQLETGPRAARALERYGLVAIVGSLDEAVAFSNDYAPEHLEIITENPKELLGRIRNAGSVFLGNYAPVPAGDYASGTNHVLPTQGYAKMFGPLSVESFGQYMQVQEIEREGLAAIRETVETLAEVEGLPAHRAAIAVRFDER